MNLELLQTVDQSYPEHNDGILDSGSEALTCSFNRRGTLLAVGCNDGRIAIWDFMTRGIARLCSGHIHPITSLSWNRSGHKLLSSSTDWNVLLWDIASGEIDLRFRFPSPVLKAQFHPRNRNVFLVCPMKNAPVLVIKRGSSGDYKHITLPTDGEPELNIVASFDRRGERIVTGSSKGKVLIIDTKSCKILKSFKLSGNAIKSIEFARRGSNFLVNSADRVIRVFNIDQIMESEDNDDIEALQRLQDLVNRTQWKKCTFSGDGEFIVAGSHRQHALYIWDKATGSLVKMLTGQKGETLLDIAWHPVRPIILSISNGVVNVWSQAQVELWSAYAPNFKEFDENEEYEEKEDEFDLEDEDSVLTKNKGLRGDREQEIDVVTVQPIPAFCSSDEDDGDALDWLPMAPEIEDPEEPGWGQLEPSLNELPATTPTTSNAPPLSNSEGGRKRPAAVDGESDDIENKPPKTKQPRTIEIELGPSTTDSSDTTESKKSKILSSSSKTSKNVTDEIDSPSTAMETDDQLASSYSKTNEEEEVIDIHKEEGDGVSSKTDDKSVGQEEVKEAEKSEVVQSFKEEDLKSSEHCNDRDLVSHDT